MADDKARALLHRYVEHYGFAPVFYEARTKGPEGKHAIGWPTHVYRMEDYRDGQNIGVKTGTSLRSGHHATDFDFDHADAFEFAKHFMRATAFGFGRKSKFLSHAFYTTDEPFASVEFEDIDGTMLSELRSVKKDGTIGLQTTVPYSEHVSGELIEPRGEMGDLGHYENNAQLFHDAALVNIALLLYLHIGKRGLLHDTRMALAGFLLKDCGLTLEETIAIGQAIAAKSDNDIGDVERTAQSTLARLKNKERVRGLGWLAKGIGTENDRGKKVVGRVLKWLNTSDFQLDDKLRPAHTQANVALALRKLGATVSFDQFSQKPQLEFDAYRGTLVDTYTRRLWFLSEEQLNFHPRKEMWCDAVEDLAWGNPYHPVLDYLDSLPEWDHTPRLDRWLVDAAGAADTEYVRAVSALPLIAAVRRVRKPGVKFDEMLVLESGEQGKFKSTALRMLCPNEDWFSDNLPLDANAQRIIEGTQGKWILEASDLSGMRESKIEALKASLSRQVDGPVRLAYGRLATEVPRQFIIIGTTNSYAYLEDSTGNRRFWPVRIEHFDVEWVKASREQLWAEAAHREAQGESIRLDPKLWPMATLQQERRRVHDAWEETLAKHFTGNYYRLTTDEVWDYLCIAIERRDARAQHRVARVMQNLGFRRASVRHREMKGPDGRGLVVKGWARGEASGKLDVADEDAG